jgi:hypothetical protein
MGVRTNVPGATDYALSEAIGAYSDEAYMKAKKLSGTGITSPNSDIVTTGETFTGQLRWKKNQSQTINVASLTDATPATLSTFSSEYLDYIKTARTHGANKINLRKLVTQDNELEKFAKELGDTQALDEHNAILAILKGVALSEAITGCKVNGLGGQSWGDTDTVNHGFYVDLATAKPVIDATTIKQGAARAEGFLNAIGMAWKDYEPEWCYLVCTPEIMASLRSANLVDQDRVEDGKIMFNTIFQGKFRLIQTRTNQSFDSAWITKLNTGAGAADLTAAAKTSFIVRPGALAMEHLMIEEDVEIDRNALAYKGGGTTSIIYRWGYVLHPMGYGWAGSKDAFPSDADYMQCLESAAYVSGGFANATSGIAPTTGVWTRKVGSTLSLGILPVFHA